tara:strand:- start:226 stop:552 length:327 start_codon:yes stop_codon:yes gene_type:complete
MTLKAVGHKLIVRRDQIETVTAGGIVLAVNERLERGGQTVGTIVSIGETAWKAFGVDFEGKPWAKAGDRVYFAKYSGKEISDPDNPSDDLVVMLDEDINALIVEKNNG